MSIIRLSWTPRYELALTCRYKSGFNNRSSHANTTVLQGMCIPNARVAVAVTIYKRDEILIIIEVSAKYPHMQITQGMCIPKARVAVAVTTYYKL